MAATPGAVAGTVATQDGGSLGEAVISLVSFDGSRAYSTGRLDFGTSASYDISDVPPGRYHGYCQPNGLSPYAPQTYFQQLGLTPSPAKAVVVRAGATTQSVDFTLVPGGRLLVTVTDSTMSPVSGALVVLQRPAKPIIVLPPVTTDDSGSALFLNVPLHVKVGVSAPGFDAGWYKNSTDFSTAHVVKLPGAGSGTELTVTVK